MIEKLFHLKENNTTVYTEVIAGITTFVTMAYILAVNPALLSSTGMDKNAVLVATVLAAFIGTMAMALLANYPFGLAPGMGMNAFFVYTVCGTMGYSWKVALTAVFAEGIIFIILSLTKVREAIFDAIPYTLKKGISAGIGLYIAFIGLQGAHVIVKNDSTLVKMIDFTDNFHQAGICALLALIGLFITFFMHIRKLKGAILYGILITWILGMLAQASGLYVPDPAAGFASLYPSFGAESITSISKTFGQCFQADFSGVSVLDFIVILFSFLFLDMFDTIGTLVGVADRAGMLDENHQLPKIRQALLADAIATTAGAVLGTSTTSTFVESSAGVAAGGRTGLAGCVTAILFGLALIFSPIFCAIPGFATAPALITVGFLMFSAVLDIDFQDLTESIPAFLALLVMPLMYSISDGIAFGIISYVVLNLCSGKKEKNSALMYVLAILFIVKYIVL